MPELAEVEYFRRQWSPGIGQTVASVEVHPAARVFRNTPAKAVQRGLKGRRFVGSSTHGKQMLFEFSDGAWMGLHLGMTGELETLGKDHPAGKHDHLVLRLEEVALVFRDPRMFGEVSLDLTGDGEPPEWWRDLPPRTLEAGFTKARLRDFLKRFPKTPIKTLLLDQRGFPGIGNWMADEICWQIRVAPQKPAGSVDEAEAGELWKAVRKVSKAAMETIGVDWSDLPDSWLMNHRWRDGGHCPRRSCRSPLVREDLRGRTTCWCPSCQALQTE